MNPDNLFRSEVVKIVSKATKFPEKEIESLLEKPRDPKLGDLSLPCFKLSRKSIEDPKEIAVDIGKTPPAGLVKDIWVAGPYVNFYADWKKVGEVVIREILKQKEKYGRSDYGKGRKVRVEYSAPNTNKPLHLGHLRNDSIGMAVSNTLQAAGFNAVRANLYSNRGIHICKSMLAYQKYGKGKKPKIKPDHFVGEYYVLYEKRKTKKLEEELKEMLRKWEKKDPHVRALWKKMDTWAIKGFRETYKRFGSVFDVEFRESDFYDKAKPVIETGLKKGVFKNDYDGAVIADLEAEKLTKKVIRRGDGTSIYITNDLALTPHKFSTFKLGKAIWVVGSEQDLYFQQLFKILELLGYPWAKDCQHLSYGMVFLPSGKMKSREGIVVDADDIMDRMTELARKEIKQREKKISKTELEKRAKAIGLGALKYFLLKMDSIKSLNFNPEESVSFEGNTGPYIQYTHARICSILKKGKVKQFRFDPSLLKDEREKILVRSLMDFPRVVQDAARDYKPNYVANYIYQLANQFNEFYEFLRVLQAEEPGMKEARLALSRAAQIVLKNGLNLLGIDAPERM